MMDIDCQDNFSSCSQHDSSEVKYKLKVCLTIASAKWILSPFTFHLSLSSVTKCNVTSVAAPSDILLVYTYRRAQNVFMYTYLANHVFFPMYAPNIRCS